MINLVRVLVAQEGGKHREIIFERPKRVGPRRLVEVVEALVLGMLVEAVNKRHHHRHSRAGNVRLLRIAHPLFGVEFSDSGVQVLPLPQ